MLSSDLSAGTLTPALRSELRSALGDAVRFDVPLSRISRWRIGGPASAIVDPGSADDVARALRVLRDSSLPVRVIGDTSNILFDSAGFGGVLLRIGRRMSKFTIDGTRMWSEAGASVPELSRAAGAASLSGIEHTIGIPGTLGGLVLMNGGSQRKGIGLNVESVTTVLPDGSFEILDRAACGFGYRASALQGSDAVIVETTLNLEQGDRESIKSEMRRVMMDRMGKFPSNMPNCGSTFLSDPRMYEQVGPPGRAIESAGLKGTRRGGALISPLHANFIVNTGGATSDDVLWLISLMRTVVEQRTGYLMDCEARFVTSDGQVRPAHEQALSRWGSVSVPDGA
ncbi:UDP-N-acetylmuramate dehydrogenase [Aeromicrobium sp. YIM 150415]|uniref:UDP-N-acetylmuramate dehydrogenase n=1 Tax=Aeromicrobium sp. YIM 150415 TaxID=2803912 RepID=UPI001962C4E5|nr:UDP-N-acetylmuramate dehydrogenase [Aeromicrobium sp. YIM 150415]MBM9463425.1 UDP-N-acetylmuramate dehydrogenase [Aeromicrobium sp. YIM 150415]